MAIEKEEWQCRHMKYLVAESVQPGSGIAKTLSCNLSEFSWKIIVTKDDFNTKMMKHLLSLDAVLSHETLMDIVSSMADSNTKLLQFALDQFSEPLPKELINSLCTQSMKKKKIHFCSSLVAKGANLNVADILKEFSLSEIIKQNSICSIIRSSPEWCTMFMTSCLKKGDARALEYCKSFIQEESKGDINFSGLLRASVQGNKDKEPSIKFIEWLIQKKYIDPNEKSEKSCPLDVVFRLPASDDKNKLCYLLLQYGANIQNATLPENDQAMILQTVALSALESGEWTFLKPHQIILSSCTY